MSAAPAIAPLLPDVIEERVYVVAPPTQIERSATIDQATWRAAVCASVVIVGCLIACFVLMNWMCCVG
jgi:hypothetical protein